MNLDTDHRLLARKAKTSFFTPVSEESRQLLWEQFLSGADVNDVESSSISVMMNRHFYIPFTLGRSCFLEFSDLCDKERSAADFRALCEHFSDIYIHGIPTMSVLKHDQARRFITLIDELYDSRVRLTWTAETTPEDTFREMQLEGEGDESVRNHGIKPPFGVDSRWGQQSLERPSDIKMPISTVDINKATAQVTLEGRAEELDILEGELASIQELEFAFQRAASRMIEMSSSEYRRMHVHS